MKSWVEDQLAMLSLQTMLENTMEFYKELEHLNLQ